MGGGFPWPAIQQSEFLIRKCEGNSTVEGVRTSGLTQNDVLEIARIAQNRGHTPLTASY